MKYTYFIAGLIVFMGIVGACGENAEPKRRKQVAIYSNNIVRPATAAMANWG